MAQQRPIVTIYEAAEYDVPQYEDIFLISGTSKKAVFESPTSGDRIIVKGQGFTYDDGVIDQGNIWSLAFIDGEVGLIQTFTNFTVRAGQIGSMNEIDFVNGILLKIQTHGGKFVGSDNGETIYGYGHDDVIFGGRGEDRLVGREGHDRLTGGQGYDVFQFDTGDGKDAITDFDFNPLDGGQDHIDAAYPGDLAIRKSGKNTVIDFGEGDSITLLGVKPADIDETDFI